MTVLVYQKGAILPYEEIVGIKCASDALEPWVHPSDQKFAKSYDFSSSGGV